MTAAKSRAARDLLVAQAAPVVGSLLVTFGTAVLLGPVGRGRVATITTTSTLLGFILSGSLWVGVSRAIDAGHDGPSAGRLCLWRILLPAGALGAICVGSAAAVGGDWLDVTFIAAGSITVGANLYFLRSAQALGMARVFRNAWLIQSIGYAILAFLAATARHQATDVLLTWLLCLLLATAYAGKHHPSIGVGGQRFAPAVREVFTSSLVSHVSTIGYQMLFRLDVVILGVFATAAQVGIYSIAVAIIGLVWIVGEAAALYVFARPSGLDMSAWYRSEQRALILTTVLATILTAVVLLTSLVLIPVALPAYTGAVPMMFALGLGVLAQVPARIIYASLSRSAEPRLLVRHGLACALAALAYVPAAARYGAMGVSVTSSILYIAHAIVAALLWRRMWADRNRAKEQW